MNRHLGRLWHRVVLLARPQKEDRLWDVWIRWVGCDPSPVLNLEARNRLPFLLDLWPWEQTFVFVSIQSVWVTVRSHLPLSQWLPAAEWTCGVNLRGLGPASVE
jgi:hypothetical protein